MKSIKDVQSLLSTLEFLDCIGAGDVLSDAPLDKGSLDIKSPKALFSDLKERMATDVAEKPVSSVSFLQTTTKPSNTDQVHDVHLKVQALNKALSDKHARLDHKNTPELKKTSAVVQEAMDLAAGAKNLTELKTVMANFNGCLLKTTATNMVFADGNPESDLMLIGEAPGADEDRQGLPFVGSSGQLLDKMLAAIKLSREQDYYITNIIPWRPPGNRPPTVEETRICLPFVRRHIELMKPKYIICIGATAAKALLGTKDSMSKLRGKWFDYIGDPAAENTSANAVPTTVLFHPSYLIRSPGQKKHAWEDLQKIEAYFLGS